MLQFIYIYLIYCLFIPDVKPHGVIVTGKPYFSAKNLHRFVYFSTSELIMRET